jgi:hypothetical protein
VNGYARTASVESDVQINKLSSNYLKEFNCFGDITISGGEKPGDFIFQMGQEIPLIAGAIPVEHAVNTYLIGMIIYAMPSGITEVINFCYQANARGGFNAIYGPPYNETRKLDENKQA